MTDKEKIRAEVERLKNNVGSALAGYDMGEENGAFLAYENVLNFIKWLPEEPVSEDLDFQTFCLEMHGVFSLPSSVTKNTEENPLNWEYAIARHFANWQKEQMMKSAIDAEVEWYDGLLLNYTQESQDIALEKIDAEVGDKVKVIIIKEDKK